VERSSGLCSVPDSAIAVDSDRTRMTLVYAPSTTRTRKFTESPGWGGDTGFAHQARQAFLRGIRSQHETSPIHGTTRLQPALCVRTARNICDWSYDAYATTRLWQTTIEVEDARPLKYGEIHSSIGEGEGGEEKEEGKNGPSRCDAGRSFPQVQASRQAAVIEDDDARLTR